MSILGADGRVTAPHRSYACGATITLDPSKHANRVGLLDTAAGSIVTLPAAVGSGNMYWFEVSVLATSNSHVVKVANATDVMEGMAIGWRTDSGNATLGFGTAATSDTVTLNRTTTGSVLVGEWIEVWDKASGFWHVMVWGVATGAAYATPFSATVS